MSEETQEGVRSGDKLAQYIGQDFLTWLWYASEVRDGQLTTSQGEVFFLGMEQRIAVEGGEGESRDTAVSSGPGSQLREAKLGLKSGKKVSRARIRIEADSESWMLQLKAADFSLSGMRTPKVQGAREEGEDPDAPFLEKMHLLQRCMDFVDDLFGQFLRLRLSEDWPDEAARVREWIKSL